MTKAAVLKQLFPQGAAKLEQHIEPQIGAWCRYGAIWWTLQRARDRLGASLPEIEKLGHPEHMPLNSDAELRRELSQHENTLGGLRPDQLLADIKQREKTLLASSLAQQVLVGVPGKKFFREVVVPPAQHDCAATEYRRLAERADRRPGSLAGVPGDAGPDALGLLNRTSQQASRMKP